jgi:sugar phosphate isomerase/epimerase
VVIADRPLAYCSNVHPAQNLADLRAQLEQHALPAAEAVGRPIGVGLWLPRSAIDGVTAEQMEDFRRWFESTGLSTTTMNAFPFGDFHAKRVKERVYQPDWTDPLRSDYTNRAADFLANLLAEGSDGSISTLPCAYRRLSPDATAANFFPQLLQSVRHLGRIHERTGRTIRLAIEPEPGCFLERTSDATAFILELRAFADLAASDDADLVREHLGLCFDVCHSAVMFENPAEALNTAAAAGIRIVKVQISSALELRDPNDRAARKFLSQFVEERYLHQTTALTNGRFLFAEDLSAPHALMPSEEWKSGGLWRVHFHVPIHKTEIGPLYTTTWAVDDAMTAVAALEDAPDLEVETYTWDVLPAISRTDTVDLAHGLAAELNHAQAILDRLRG